MSYELLPESDEYIGCVIPSGNASITFGESSKKQTPYASVKLGITEGEFTGRWIYFTGYLTEKTIVKTVKALHAMGFKGNNLTAFMDQSPSAAVTIAIAHEEYEGKTRARVKWVSPVGEKLSTSALDALSAKFEELAKAEEASSNGVQEDSSPDPLPGFFDIPGPTDTPF